MTRLLLAAGGGGDAVAAAAIHTAVFTAEPAVIASWSWDRLIIDSLPGPRGIDSFTGLRRYGKHTWRLSAESRPIAPAGSTLPRLAAEIPVPLILLDPYSGVHGLTQQLRDAIEVFAIDNIDIIDVGGDVLGRGTEPEIRSPILDALSLASCAELPVPIRIIVAGPGVDGELSQEYVLARIAAATGIPLPGLSGEDFVTSQKIFRWHPTEATSLWFAASVGARGTVEFGGTGATITLDERSADIYQVDYDQIFRTSVLAQALVDTRDFTEIEELTRSIAGFSEVDGERARAATLDHVVDNAPSVALGVEKIRDISRQAAERGTDFLTFRCLAQAVVIPRGEYELFRNAVTARWPERCETALWQTN